MEKRILCPFEQTGYGNLQVEELRLSPGEDLPLAGYPEERLYYVKSGFGSMTVYDDLQKGDIYIIRPNVTLFYTPGLRHYMKNTGDHDMRLILFRITGGLMPAGTVEGIQKWTGAKEGDVGCGFWYTDIFNARENETVREGLGLEIWGVIPRRPQKFDFGEVLKLSRITVPDHIPTAILMRPSTSSAGKEISYGRIARSHVRQEMSSVIRPRSFAGSRIPVIHSCYIFAYPL